ncbi:Amiloride-sensitive sodium channel subunit alpha [Armadillidium vulgare]|nr:Amiloride-sensitive sodium channel subunit alpha [Armadillidium vulgare]
MIYIYDFEYLYSTDHEEVEYLITESSSPDASDVIDGFLMTEPQVESYTMSSEEFITSCSFNNMPCSPSDLKEWTSDKYGKCYTFNSFFDDDEVNGKKTKRNVKKARTAGPKSGLKLTLNVKTANALSLFSAERGVKVIIHSPKTIPFPEEEGFNVQPDASTDIQLKIKNING